MANEVAREDRSLGRRQSALIFDHHTHIYPSLGDERYGSLEFRYLFLRRSFVHTMQGVRRMSDHSRVEDPLPTLFKIGEGTGVADLRPDVQIVPDKFGRLMWECDGEKYYTQWLPPALQRLEAPEELMLAEMDYVGPSESLPSKVRAVRCMLPRYARSDESRDDRCRPQPLVLLEAAKQQGGGLVGGVAAQARGSASRDC